MNIKQAANRLSSKLGFTMIDKWGKKTPEVFVTPYHILSTPFRDVFIGKCKGGWYITSHIIFTARRKYSRSHNTFQHCTNNIFGSSRTLKEAIESFEQNFKTLTYNNYQRLTI